MQTYIHWQYLDEFFSGGNQNIFCDTSFLKNRAIYEMRNYKKAQPDRSYMI
jgi:hypothetical protein